MGRGHGFARVQRGGAASDAKEHRERGDRGLPSLGVLAWFDVPFRGSIALFVLASALALAASLAIGILISTFARTLQQPLRVLSLASPVRHHMEIALGVIPKRALG